MKHLNLQPIEGVSGREPTVFTKKTIKEILEEEAEALIERGLQEEAETAKALAEAAAAAEAKASEPVQVLEPVQPSAAPNVAPKLSQPPQFDRDLAEPVSPFPTDPKPVAAEPAKPKGFLRRLIGG